MNRLNKIQVIFSLFITFLLVFFSSSANEKSLINFIELSTFVTILFYFFLIYIALNAFSKNKIVGISLFLTVLFLPPNIFPQYKGELFPITYSVYIAYLLYLLNIKIFNNWKNRL